MFTARYPSPWTKALLFIAETGGLAKLGRLGVALTMRPASASVQNVAGNLPQKPRPLKPAAYWAFSQFSQHPAGGVTAMRFGCMIGNV